MSRANLTGWAWDAPLPLIRADSYARPWLGDVWTIFTPSASVYSLFMGSEEEVKGTLSEGGTIKQQDGGHWVIDEPFA